jgi:Toprim-like/Protein of unknown function (DUF3991)
MISKQSRDRFHQLRAIPLESVLVASAAQRDPHDKAKWHTAKGPISITGMKFMNWNQGHGGGGAIDLAMHLNGLDFKAAIAWLARCFSIPDDLPPPPVPRSFVLPLPDRSKLYAIERYLIHGRGITATLIETLVESGTLYADTRVNAVFQLFGKDNQPVGAELRGTGSSRWRGMAPGSRKDLGYFCVAAPHATMIILCESAIDAMSCSLLHPASMCVSTAGVRSNPQWLPSLLSPDSPVYCGFDADPTGDATANQMIRLYPQIRRLRPTVHDWNDLLMSRRFR